VPGESIFKMDAMDVLSMPVKPLQIIEQEEFDEESTSDSMSTIIGGDLMPMLDLGWNRKPSSSSPSAEAQFKESSPDLTSFLKGAIIRPPAPHSNSGSSFEDASSPELKSSYSPSLNLFEYRGYTPASTSTGSGTSAGSGNFASKSPVRPLDSIWNENQTSIWTNDSPRNASPIVPSKGDKSGLSRSGSFVDPWKKESKVLNPAADSLWNAQSSATSATKVQQHSLPSILDSSKPKSDTNIQTTSEDISGGSTSLRSSNKAKEACEYTTVCIYSCNSTTTGKTSTAAIAKKFKTSYEKRVEAEKRLGKRGARILARMQSRRIDRKWQDVEQNALEQNRTEAFLPNQQSEIFDMECRRSLSLLSPTPTPELQSWNSLSPLSLMPTTPENSLSPLSLMPTTPELQSWNSLSPLSLMPTTPEPIAISAIDLQSFQLPMTPIQTFSTPWRNRRLQKQASFRPEKDSETRGRALNYKSCGGYAGTIDRKTIDKAWHFRKSLNLRYTRCSWKGKLDMDANHVVACKKNRQFYNQDLIAPTLVNFEAAQEEWLASRSSSTSFYSDRRSASPFQSWTVSGHDIPVTPELSSVDTNGEAGSPPMPFMQLNQGSGLTSNINPKSILNEIVQHIWKRYPSEIIHYNVEGSDKQWMCHVRLEPLAKTFKGDVCFSKKDAQSSAASKCIAFMVSQKTWNKWLKWSIFEKIVASGCLKAHADNPSRNADTAENNQTRRKGLCTKDQNMSSCSKDLKSELNVLAMKKWKADNGRSLEYITSRCQVERPPAPFMSTVLVTPLNKSFTSKPCRSKKMAELDASEKALHYIREMSGIQCDVPTGLNGSGSSPQSLSASSNFNSQSLPMSDPLHSSCNYKKTADKESTQPDDKSTDARFPFSCARFERFSNRALRKQYRL